MPAWQSWLRGEMEGVLQAAASSKKWLVAMARRRRIAPVHPHRAHHQHTALGVWCLIGCTCEMLCVQEVSRERNVEAPAACSWLGEGRAAGTAEEEGAEAERQASGR